MSRLFSGTPFEQPLKCDLCGKYLGAAEGCCRCIKSTLPPKKKMSDRPGGKHAAAAAAPKPAAYQLTPANADPPADQVARLRTERRKGNREVTVITGLEHPANDLPALLAALKSALACGGSVQDRTIELQGGHAATAAAHLQEESIKTRII